MNSIAQTNNSENPLSEFPPALPRQPHSALCERLQTPWLPRPQYLPRHLLYGIHASLFLHADVP